MSEKRRDKKGRLLWNGESQRKDGKYEYKYVDAKGVRHSAYSWKLVDTDKVPAGKRCEMSLREMEKQIQRDIEDGIKSYESKRITLNDFWQMYIDMKYELKQSTRTNYKYMYTKYVADDLGLKNISSIKYSDIKKFYQIQGGIIMRRKIKVKFTDFECNLLVNGMNEFRNMLLAENLPTDDVDELLLKIIDKSEK